MSTIQECLQKERAAFPCKAKHFSQFLYRGHSAGLLQYLQSSAVPDYDQNLHQKSRVELIKNAYDSLPLFTNRQLSNSAHLTSILLGSPHQQPGSASFGKYLVKQVQMILNRIAKEVELKTHRQFLDKCKNYQVVGCYAQTELGHGSDVRSLETTATYDKGSFILNTPSVSATKYWPGEAGLLANYALVFAQLLIDGQNFGVQPFLVQIRDNHYQLLPGIDGGDIGPKIGFHAKENGFLSFNHVRLPNDSLCSKYVQIKDGKYESKGNVMIGYGTMMYIREIISCEAPKIYGQAITISLRYSFFRKQFKDEKNNQLAVINYQAQQQKLLPRLAQYYALVVTGNRIKELSRKNLSLLLEGDMSLIKETHCCLSVSKALFSETVYDGIELCRRACGGHGYSYYSGFPGLLQEYAAHNTHEGQNTVLYLQCGKYLTKEYLKFKQNANYASESITSSISYIFSAPYILDSVLSTTVDAESIRILLAKRVCQQLQNWYLNQQNSFTLNLIAKLHGEYFTYECFYESVISQKIPFVRFTLLSLCELFGLQCVLRGKVVSGVSADYVLALREAYESRLKETRKAAVGLMDGIGFPEKYFRSAMSAGDPYKNYIDFARKSQINKQLHNKTFRKNILQVIGKGKL